MKIFVKILSVVMAAAMTVSAGAISASANSRETGFDSQFLNDMGLCPDR